VLTAVLLRESGIPAKLVMGYKKGMDVYHAWNEVYLNGDWVTVDTTLDAVFYQSNQPYTFAKDASQYKAEKVY
jgi:transglutaminase-like putative cysteine protease